jgi:hypothetical protein
MNKVREYVDLITFFKKQRTETTDDADKSYYEKK